jgi:hypothetical protein
VNMMNVSHERLFSAYALLAGSGSGAAGRDGGSRCEAGRIMPMLNGPESQARYLAVVEFGGLR